MISTPQMAKSRPSTREPLTDDDRAPPLDPPPTYAAESAGGTNDCGLKPY